MGPFSFLFPESRQTLVHKASRGIASARRRGRNTYRSDWHFGIEAEARLISGSLLAWCRDTVACCRRPFGIDYFDLAIAIVDKQGARRDELSLNELRPGVLYDAASLEDKLVEYIERRRRAFGEGAIHISTALFSWGDAAHEALPARV
jgi:hypothetical protein